MISNVNYQFKWFGKLVVFQSQAAIKAAKMSSDGRDEEISALRQKIEASIFHPYSYSLF